MNQITFLSNVSSSIVMPGSKPGIVVSAFTKSVGAHNFLVRGA